jgi:hypothetical protein
MVLLHSELNHIHGCDDSNLEPYSLHLRLRAVPQEQLIFLKDNLRSNLPLRKSVDGDKSRKVLESVDLWFYIASKNGLDGYASLMELS